MCILYPSKRLLHLGKGTVQTGTNKHQHPLDHIRGIETKLNSRRYLIRQEVTPLLLTKGHKENKPYFWGRKLKAGLPPQIYPGDYLANPQLKYPRNALALLPYYSLLINRITQSTLTPYKATIPDSIKNLKQQKADSILSVVDTKRILKKHVPPLGYLRFNTLSILNKKNK